MRSPGNPLGQKDPRYPPGTWAGDPRAPWNEKEGTKAVYDVTVIVSVVAHSEDEAVAMIQRAVADAGDLETISAVYIEDV